MMRIVFVLSGLLAALMMAGSLQASAPGKEVDLVAVAADIAQRGDAAMTRYEPDHGMDTAEVFSDIYFDVFEGSGMEAVIGLNDPGSKSELESLFSSIIGLASRARPHAEVSQAWEKLRTRIGSVAFNMAGKESEGFWSTLLQSFLILLREGFEAILVITALITYLKRQGEDEKLPVIYHGVAWALTASVLTAILLSVVFEVSGAVQEALEGMTMLIAAGVLFYVSYWLISKREAARWQAYIRTKMNRALSRGSVLALGFAAFLAVYREGAETVLFYQAMAGQADGGYGAIALGFVLALLALGSIYWLMRTASFRLPIGLFFTLTAGLLYYLAISFAGSGMLELQAANWVGITPLEWVPRIPWLGLYPSVETVLAQLVLLIPLPVALGLWAWQRRQYAGSAEKIPS
ncbi:MAG: FTR1 family iron permease [Gammaproteobacteria bacterium]|jgi:high-affinity iron transporter